MRKLLAKECRLAASPLSYLFLLAAFLTLVPGYPVLVGVFFVTLGIFQSFQTTRETNDTLYTALLPVAKRDIVRAKYAFCILIEGIAFFLMAVLALLRMTAFAASEVYRANALMNANLVFLGFALLLFGLFNAVFVGGFYRTAYKFGKPFFAYIAVSAVVIGIAETLHHIPALARVNAFGFEELPLQLVGLAGGLLAFLVLTLGSMRVSEKRFERIDL